MHLATVALSSTINLSDTPTTHYSAGYLLTMCMLLTDCLFSMCWMTRDMSADLLTHQCLTHGIKYARFWPQVILGCRGCSLQELLIRAEYSEDVATLLLEALIRQRWKVKQECGFRVREAACKFRPVNIWGVIRTLKKKQTCYDVGWLIICNFIIHFMHFY